MIKAAHAHEQIEQKDNQRIKQQRHEHIRQRINEHIPCLRNTNTPSGSLLAGSWIKVLVI